jgi:hypothetical protein
LKLFIEDDGELKVFGSSTVTSTATAPPPAATTTSSTTAAATSPATAATEVLNNNQTSTSAEIGLQCNLDKQYTEALKKIVSLEKKLEKAKLLTKKEKSEIVKNHLVNLGHSETAIKHILNPTIHHRNFSQEDICNGLILRCMSSKTFEYLRKNKILPLPSQPTMSKWLGQFSCKPGFNNNFIQIVEKKLQGEESLQKEAILMFDELDLKKTFEYDYVNKQVYGGYKKLQCVMVRGLFGSWKQLVYFNFDTNMTKDLITEIILQCEQAGIKIRGLSFDCGNHTLLQQLGVLVDLAYFFPNPADPSRKIYLFPDVPHLLKLLRKISISL